MKLKNKVALITGAAVGIGRATAIVFAEQGAKLVLIDVNEEKLEALKKELEVYTKEVLTVVCDVTDEALVQSTVQQAEEAFGGVDILVNNAGLWRCSSLFTDTPTDEWKRFLDVNVMGPVYFTKATLPLMLSRGWGRIINVASVAGVYGNAKMTHYSATKGALIAMTKALAKEVSKNGVTVNSVSPGSVSPSENPDIDYTEESQLSFAGRTGSGRENAELIAFLASEAAGYISGQNIQIDGCRKKQ